MSRPQSRWLRLVTQCVLSASLMLSFGCSEDSGGTAGSGGGAAGSGGSAGSGGGTAGSGGDAGTNGGGDVAATLTIGGQTWEFDEFGCVFGYEASGTDDVSFNAAARGQDTSGVSLQLSVDVIDDSGEERLEGQGVQYVITIDDISNLAEPTIAWASESFTPFGQTVIEIDGERVTGEGLFDDGTTDLEIEQEPGTLEATCTESRR